MLCSHARSQPACFSGRTTSSPLLQGRHTCGFHPSLKSFFTVLAAAQQTPASEAADTEALRTSAAGLRAKLASFDSKSYIASQRREASEVQELAEAAFSQPLKRDFATKVCTCKNDTPTAPETVPASVLLLVFSMLSCNLSLPKDSLSSVTATLLLDRVCHSRKTFWEKISPPTALTQRSSRISGTLRMITLSLVGKQSMESSLSGHSRQVNKPELCK